MPLLPPPIREHDGRRTMRSLADALVKLREDGFSDEEYAQFKATGFVLPPDSRLPAWLKPV